jgi:electron transfer flavoprotein beta subunit
MALKILVTAKRVEDPESKIRVKPDGSGIVTEGVNYKLNPFDEIAIEEALRLKEAHGGEVVVVCMGPERAEEAVRKVLAMGTDRALLVTDPALAGSDAQGTAYVLAEALKTLPWDLVLFGVRSTDGETGCVPAAVAERLGVPVLSALAKVEVQGSTLKVQRETEQGYVAYECPTPAVLSVIKGINDPRYPSMMGIMGAKKKPLDRKDVSGLALDPAQVGLPGAKTRVLSARSPEPRKAGVKVEDDGAGAQKIADFLTSEKLV